MTSAYLASQGIHIPPLSNFDIYAEEMEDLGVEIGRLMIERGEDDREVQYLTGLHQRLSIMVAFMEAGALPTDEGAVAEAA